ncbi:Aspartate aminotransferase, cytoplasmic, partial [Blyttiomyces sp. JEL0837]
MTAAENVNDYIPGSVANGVAKVAASSSTPLTGSKRTATTADDKEVPSTSHTTKQVPGQQQAVDSTTTNNKKKIKSGFDHIPSVPMDPIFALANACVADPDPYKINLGIGAYRDDNGQPWVLPVVKKARESLIKDTQFNHEYLPIDGIRSFTDAAALLILGKDSPAIKEKRYLGVQAVSGTGAVRLGADFLARFRKSPVYISDPSWGNHAQIFEDTGYDFRFYQYWDPVNRCLAFDKMIETFKNAPLGSIIVLHACAHNPTGVDPTVEQWKIVADGFASGDLDRDAWAVRYFVELGFEVLVAQSFSKNFGLYSERAGCLTVVTSSEAQANNIRSQMMKLIRASYSNAPAFGARIVEKVLNNPELNAEWQSNLRQMADRIILMREKVVEHLTRLKTPGTWSHFKTQIGMFSYTGLSLEQVRLIRSKFHVYMTDSGRVSMAGLNLGNVERFAEAVDFV